MTFENSTPLGCIFPQMYTASEKARNYDFHVEHSQKLPKKMKLATSHLLVESLKDSVLTRSHKIKINRLKCVYFSSFCYKFYHRSSEMSKSFA